MTVSTVVDHNDYTGNGVTVSFPYTFRIFQKSDLVVQVVDLNESVTTLMLDTDYTVTGAGGYTGGNVVLNSPLTSNWQISISRELEPTQETDLRNQGKFFAEVHEDAFDKLTMLIQQAYSSFRLALRKPSSIANYYDALNNRIRNLRDPSLDMDAVNKRTAINIAKSIVDSSVIGMGLQELGDWKIGLVVSQRNQIVWYDHAWYQYNGVLPHTISASTPELDGGVWSEGNPSGLWVNVGVSPLREYVDDNFKRKIKRFASIEDAKSSIDLISGDIASVALTCYLVSDEPPKSSIIPVIQTSFGKYLIPSTGAVKTNAGSFTVDSIINKSELLSNTSRLQGAEFDYENSSLFLSYFTNISPPEQRSKVFEYEYDFDNDSVGSLKKVVDNIPSGHGDYFALVRNGESRVMLFGKPVMALHSVDVSSGNIAIFGDSTTDGYNTTGWTQNPVDVSGNAIGGTDHNLTAPNAWPSVLQSKLRASYGDGGINVYNAGYTGKALIDDWAINNINAAIFSNSAFENVRYIFVAFGLNDIVRPSWNEREFRLKYNNLIKVIKSHGITPVIVTSDPVASNVDRPSKIVQGSLVPLQKSIAIENGLLCFDMNLAVMSVSGWQSMETDGLHLNDAGHEIKAQSVHDSIRNINADPFGPGTIAAMDWDVIDPVSTVRQLIDFSYLPYRVDVSNHGDQILVQLENHSVHICDTDDILSGIFSPVRYWTWQQWVNLGKFADPGQNIKGSPDGKTFFGLTGLYTNNWGTRSFLTINDGSVISDSIDLWRPSDPTATEVEVVCHKWNSSTGKYVTVVMSDPNDKSVMMSFVSEGVSSNGGTRDKTRTVKTKLSPQYLESMSIRESRMPFSAPAIFPGSRTDVNCKIQDFAIEQIFNNDTRKGARIRYQANSDTNNTNYEEIVFDGYGDTQYGEGLRFTIGQGGTGRAHLTPDGFYSGNHRLLSQVLPVASCFVATSDNPASNAKIGLVIGSTTGDLPSIWCNANNGYLTSLSAVRIGSFTAPTKTYTEYLQILPTGYTWRVPSASDRRLKYDIEYLSPESCLNRVLKMKPADYSRISDKKRARGFIAQDSNKVDRLLGERNNGVYGVHFEAVTADNTGAIIELFKIIDSLRDEIAILKK